MAKPVTHISVFLATPGDVVEERRIAFEAIHEWNDCHSSEKSAALQIKTWQTSTYPELGKRPQAVVNEQALDDCDIVVGIFWTRFGSPTGIAESGTEEEIRRSAASNKHVLLYFSDVPASPSRVDQAQYKKVTQFRDEFRNSGLVWSYDSHEQFKDCFRRHLDSAVQRLIARLRTDHISASGRPLSPTLNIQTNEGVAAAVIENFIYKAAPKGSRRSAFAPGSIGSDPLRKNYVSYLVRRYNEFLKIGRESFGDKRNVRYSFLSTRIIQVFRVPANDLLLCRFEEVVNFIKEYIDGSIVGLNNRAKGWKSYDSFEEFCAQQMTKKPRRKKSDHE